MAGPIKLERILQVRAIDYEPVSCPIESLCPVKRLNTTSEQVIDIISNLAPDGMAVRNEDTYLGKVRGVVYFPLEVVHGEWGQPLVLSVGEFRSSGMQRLLKETRVFEPYEQ